MGTDKAFIEVGGRRLIDRAVAVLTAVADPVIEVGPGWSGLPAVREDPPGSGPLAALSAGATGLRRSGHLGPVLVLAVDMPSVTIELLRFLARRPGPETAVPRAGGYPQPMCARYGPLVLAAVDERLAAGGRSLRDLLEAMVASGEVGWVEPEEWGEVVGPEAFADVDTPEDLQRLREAAEGS
jgi:molybdopterin-guanine dinucleotide biosynthesis protein A